MPAVLDVVYRGQCRVGRGDLLLSRWWLLQELLGGWQLVTGRLTSWRLHRKRGLTWWGQYLVVVGIVIALVSGHCVVFHVELDVQSLSFLLAL